MIQTFHLGKIYEREERPALDDVSIEIARGEFVFLTGPSGAGKTTLLELLFLAERPTKGQILIDGKNVATLAPREVPHLRRRMGVVFQDFKLIANRTVYQNVAYALHVVGLPESEIRARVQRVLKGVGLSHKSHALPQKLSGGEQQRVAIARALANDPILLLADEPTGNLDDDITRDIMGLLEDANARGTTVMVATHDRALLDAHRKRTIHLRNGRVTETSTSAARAEPNNAHFFG